MRGEKAESFVVLGLRLLALSFAVVGILFIAVPNGVLDTISDLGDEIGSFTAAPHGTEQLWLALGFSYMVVITGICLIAQSDVVRYRPLLLLLAVGKAASSLTSLGFYLFDEDVFAYLLNFLVDGSLVARRALALVAGRSHRPPARRRLKARAGALRRRATHAERDLRIDGARHRRPARRRARRRRLRPGRRVPQIALAADAGQDQARAARLRVAALPLAIQPPRRRRPATTSCAAWSARASASTTSCCCWRRSSRPWATRCSPRSRSGSGSRPAAGSPTAACRSRAGSLGDTSPQGDGEECDVVIVGSGAGGAARGGRAGRGRPRRDRARGGRPLQPRQLPAGPPRLDRDPLPRRRPDHGRGQPADPGPGRESGRRNDGDQLGHLLPRTGRGPRQLARRARGELGPRPRPLLRRGRGVPAGHARSTPSAWAATASSRWRGPKRWASPAARSPATPATASSAAPAPTAARSTPSAAMHVSYLPRAVAAGARVRTGVEARRLLVEDGRAVGVECLAGRRQRVNGSRRPYTVRARRATIVAGGAFGTPELLIRSGLGGGQVGRNLHIHPACWVGARYEEEVRGWEGVMQSYYLDEWECRAGPARGDLHPARLRRRLAAGRRPRPPGGDARLRPHLLDRGPARRPLERPGRPARRRLAEDHLQADRRRRATASSSASHGPPKSTSPPAPPRSTPTSPAPGSCAPGQVAEFEATRFKPSELRLEAFHPMGTARISGDEGAGRLRLHAALSAGSRASTSPTPRSSRRAAHVNPMMTIIAFAKQVAAGIAAEATPAAA